MNGTERKGLSVPEEAEATTRASDGRKATNDDVSRDHGAVRMKACRQAGRTDVTLTSRNNE